MKNSFSYFKNDACEYFPCHKTEDSETFNCLCCYCPLYHLENCGGNCHFTKDGIKDCSDCLVPHQPENYTYILEKLNHKK